MSDETVKDDAPETPDLGPDASKADLKAAADEILKAAKAADSGENADEALEADVEEAEPLTLDQQILALEVEKQEMRDQMLRALAEMENLRKRAEREALTEGGKGLLGGIEMTQKELHTVLTRHGVTAIEAEPGAAFDPNLHQAVANIPSEHPNGTIASLFQAGWRIGDRTLRAAMVAVSAGQAN